MTGPYLPDCPLRFPARFARQDGAAQAGFEGLGELGRSQWPAMPLGPPQRVKIRIVLGPAQKIGEFDTRAATLDHGQPSGLVTSPARTGLSAA